MPYRVSKGRHDQDTKKALCATYDVVFHPMVEKMIVHTEFQKFVSDTACDGVDMVLRENKEKCSRDYKIMYNLKCKGGNPALMTVKVETGKITDNIDIDKHETGLQKEIKNQVNEYHKGSSQQTTTSEEPQVESEDEEEPEETRPETVVQPKHKIVYTYPVSMGDAW